MVNIILQHFDGELRELDKLSVENIKRYANTVGAEYQLVTGKPFRSHLTAPCQKVYMLDECWDEYDNVLMLDIDMFTPKYMNENIFDLEGVGLYADVQKRLHTRIASDYPLIASSYYAYWGGAIYKLDRDQRKKLRSYLDGNDSWMNNFNKPYHFEDEGIMHVLATRAGIKLKGTVLEQKWCQCSFLPAPRKAGFIHIRTKIKPQGPKQEKIKNYLALVDQGIL